MAVQNRAISWPMGMVLPGIAYICPLLGASSTICSFKILPFMFEKLDVKLVQKLIFKPRSTGYYDGLLTHIKSNVPKFDGIFSEI